MDGLWVRARAEPMASADRSDEVVCVEGRRVLPP